MFAAVKGPDGREIPSSELPTLLAIERGCSFRGIEAVAYRKDGSSFVANLSVDPVKSPDGDVEGAIVVFEDVSGRKRADEKVSHLAAIVESSDDAIVSKNLDGMVTSWNIGAERIFGYSAAEMIGSSITRIIPAHLQSEEGEILRKIRSGDRIDHYETVRQRKDGRLIDISLTISPIKNARGDIIGASKIARDIGRLKRIEEDLRIADQRKNQFLATLAHELRGPLAPLSNALQIMKLNQPSQPSPELQAIMDRQLRQMTRLIDDLLDIGRITSRKLVLEKEVVDLAAVLREVVQASAAEAESAGHEFLADLPAGELRVRGDSVRLMQIFTNLLHNAIKYTSEGGRISLDVRREDRWVEIFVTDNGIGIDPAKLTVIFDLFVQADHSLEKRFGGLGIGLTLARQLVEMQGGSIEAFSEGQGQGSCFRVRLPLVTQLCANGNSIPAEANGSSMKRKILVFDDNVDSAVSLATLLDMLGNETRTAHDGLAAVHAAMEFSPDIIFLDIGMPMLNGFDACKRIRSSIMAKQPFIIALTGWGQEEDRRHCKEAGFDHHFVKPVDPPELLSILEKLDQASACSLRPG